MEKNMTLPPTDCGETSAPNYDNWPEQIAKRMRAVGQIDYSTVMRERVERYNASEGPYTERGCSKCHNKGNILVIVDGDEQLHFCDCEKVARAKTALLNSGLISVAERYTFDAYKATEDWQRRAKDIAMRYTQDCEGKWLALLGQPGCGKTHLGTAAAITLLNERAWPLKYMPWRDTVARIKALATNDEEYQAIMQAHKTARILYVDDLFKVEARTHPTGADINVAFELLNYRYNNPGLVTIISSEHTIDRLLSIDEAVGSRIYERTRDYCVGVKPDLSKNYRVRDAS